MAYSQPRPPSPPRFLMLHGLLATGQQHGVDIMEDVTTLSCMIGRRSMMVSEFGCVETETPGVWKVHFTGPSPFATPMTARELEELCRMFDQVLLLGVFSWSNWSRDTVRAIQQNTSWFEDNRIGLALFCLGDPSHAEQLCPGFSAYYLQANTEPAMVLLAKGAIKKVRFGPIGIDAIKEWIVI